MQTKPLNERLAQLEPRLRRLCEITGLPGCSLGVIHNNEETWRLNLGFRDVEQQLATQSDTVFNLNSLTKGVTAAAYACLVEDGQVTWNTRIKCILPDFSSGADQINQEITALDLLSMRTGHQPFGSLAWQGNNIVLPPKSDTIQYWNATPRTQGFRSSFIYNNWAYGIIAIVIEKLSGQPFAEYLQDKIFQPLGLKRTKMQDNSPFENSAASYAILEDRSPIRIAAPAVGSGSFTEGGSGVLSTIDDMLCLYRTYMEAIKSEFAMETRPEGNPFVGCTHIVRHHNSLEVKNTSLREQTYGCGWVRCQLPGPLGMLSTNSIFTDPPDVLKGGPSRLCLYHQGMMVGSTANVAMIPETGTVVAILGNAAPLGDAIDWMSQIILEEIFESPTRHPYEVLAEATSSKILDHIPSIGRQLEAGRVAGTHASHSLHEYSGTFVHDKTPFRIFIHLQGNDLEFTFMGVKEETYRLRHYHYDTFTWWMPYSENARRARFLHIYTAETFLFVFDGVDQFQWQSGDLGPEPYTFKRLDQCSAKR